jgi:hypothetical protein
MKALTKYKIYVPRYGEWKYIGVGVYLGNFKVYIETTPGSFRSLPRFQVGNKFIYGHQCRYEKL